MKSFVRSLVAIAGLLVLTAAAAPHAQGTDTVTNVPFAFNVGKTAMPRDSYTISRLPGHMDAFMIRGLRHTAIVTSQPADRGADATPRLVFHRYGDSYFLREVHMGGSTGFELPATRAERDAAERVADASTHEVVVVRAQ